MGRRHGVQPKNIVGAISNEGGITSKYIGRIDLEDDHSFVELPPNMPKDLMSHLKHVVICGEALGIRPAEPGESGGDRRGKRNKRGRKSFDGSFRKKDGSKSGKRKAAKSDMKPFFKDGESKKKKKGKFKKKKNKNKKNRTPKID